MLYSKCMKKLILTTLFCLLAFRGFSLELPQSITDLESYAKYINKNFKYKAEFKWIIGDYWQTPEQTIQLKTFDCEDIACLTYTVLKQFGYKPTIYVLIGKANHAVCVVKKDGYVVLFNNQYMYKGRFTNEITLLKLYFRPKEIHRLIKIRYGRILFNLEKQAILIWEDKK